MCGIGVVAVGGREVGLELRLQIGGIELRERLPGMHRITFAYVHGSGRFGETALDGDVLIRRDHARQLTRGLNRAEARDGRFDKGCGRRRGRFSAGAARHAGKGEKSSEESSQKGIPTYHD